MSSLTVGDFVLPLPSDWHIASLILVGPVDSAPGAPNFQQNVVVVSEPVEASETAETYVQKQTAKLKEQKALSQSPGALEKITTGNGRSAVMFEHVVLGPNGERVRQLQVVSIDKGRMHALIASHLDGPRFAAQRPALRQMLAAVKLP